MNTLYKTLSQVILLVLLITSIGFSAPDGAAMFEYTKQNILRENSHIMWNITRTSTYNIYKLNSSVTQFKFPNFYRSFESILEKYKDFEIYLSPFNAGDYKVRGLYPYSATSSSVFKRTQVRSSSGLSYLLSTPPLKILSLNTKGTLLYTPLSIYKNGATDMFLATSDSTDVLDHNYYLCAASNKIKQNAWYFENANTVGSTSSYAPPYLDILCNSSARCWYISKISTVGATQFTVTYTTPFKAFCSLSDMIYISGDSNDYNNIGVFYNTHSKTFILKSGKPSYCSTSPSIVINKKPIQISVNNSVLLFIEAPSSSSAKLKVAYYSITQNSHQLQSVSFKSYLNLGNNEPAKVCVTSHNALILTKKGKLYCASITGSNIGSLSLYQQNVEDISCSNSSRFIMQKSSAPYVQVSSSCSTPTNVSLVPHTSKRVVKVFAVGSNSGAYYVVVGTPK